MKRIFLLLVAICFYSLTGICNTVTISGIVTDFEGNPIDSATVLVKDHNFQDIYSTISDSNGNYSLEVEAGTYTALACVQLKDYGKSKLEFWAWNLIAEDDLELNIRYDRVEVYGVNVFQVPGAYPGYMIYFRPMCLSRFLTADQTAKIINLAPEPENLELEIFINNESVKINSIQQVEEFIGQQKMIGYLIQTDLAANQETLQTVIKIVAKDKKYGDIGEAIYFYQ